MTNPLKYRVKSRYISDNGKHFSQWMSIRNGDIRFNSDFDEADHFHTYADAMMCASLTLHDINTGAAHPENFVVSIEENILPEDTDPSYYGVEVWKDCHVNINAVVNDLTLL